jgi:hypothetical protein
MTLGVNQQALMPVEQQLDRPPGDIRQHCSMDLPGDILFSTKTAAHQLADHTHPLFRPA